MQNWFSIKKIYFWGGIFVLIPGGGFAQKPVTQTTVVRPTTSAFVTHPTTATAVTRPTTKVSVLRPTTSVAVQHATTQVPVSHPKTEESVVRPTTVVSVLHPTTQVAVEHPTTPQTGLHPVTSGSVVTVPAKGAKKGASADATTSMTGYQPPKAKEFKPVKLGGGEAGLGKLNEAEKDAAAAAFKPPTAVDPSSAAATAKPGEGSDNFKKSAVMKILGNKVADKK